ncbi:MAG: SGNH/GDSL hydrolase family protein, partial [Vicinamibacteria bacterium]|nr:SGNH/GDSL hydrolase family protein [Vicinamibacteria bacterium]
GPERFEHPRRIANGKRTLLLDAYPSNPHGELDVDLRDAATRERYRAAGLRRVDEAARFTPFAVERRTNSRRFRGPEFGDKVTGVTRVAVIGDSFTEGMGAKEDDAYPRATHLRLQRAGAAVEVLNAGRRGYDLLEIRDLLGDALELQPDVVVYGMVLNDGIRSPEFDARQRHLDDWILDRAAMERGDAAPPPPRPWRPRLVTFFTERLEAARVGRETTAWYHDMYAAPNAAGWQRSQELIVEMRDRVRARGGTFAIALWPLLVGTDGDYPFAATHETIRAFCAAMGIPFLDLLPAFTGRTAESLWVHPVDRHPNATAHAMAADRLAPWFRELAAPR